MRTLLDLLQVEMESVIFKLYGKKLEAHPHLLKPEIFQTVDPRFGDYQCNNSLKLGKELHMQPRQVATELLTHFDHKMGHSYPIVKKIEIAGPGFINFTIDPQFLGKEISAILDDPFLATPRLKRKTRIIVEFSSPNIAKELHVGHLRSTIIGDALARLFEFLGYDVCRLNHIGDWGTQFGMLIAYLREHQKNVLTGRQEASIEELMTWYRKSKELFDQDPEFKKRSHKQVVLLQGGDESSLEAWEKICDISRKAFQEIYELLDIQLTERGESFYNPYLPVVVADLEKKGLVTISDGAKCIFLEGFTARDGAALPMIIQKSDGGYNYDTTDVAAMRHRVEVEKAERIIVVTDAGQSLHFQMVQKVAEKAGYLDPAKTQFDHVPFGVVLGPDGKKFKTRSGNTERLIDLILEAITKAKTIFRERLPDAADREIDELATILGVDAIKYADLCSHRVKDYLFSYERMLKFEGNTAPFLLYAYVRIQSIKKKVAVSIIEAMQNGKIDLEHPSEIALALHLRQFGEALEAMARELLPNRLCDYLYNLVEKFNGFFRDCRVEGSPQETSRLLLAEATGRILEKGLNILGLKTLPKM